MSVYLYLLWMLLVYVGMRVLLAWAHEQTARQSRSCLARMRKPGRAHGARWEQRLRG